MLTKTSIKWNKKEKKTKRQNEKSMSQKQQEYDWKRGLIKLHRQLKHILRLLFSLLRMCACVWVKLYLWVYFAHNWSLFLFCSIILARLTQLYTSPLYNDSPCWIAAFIYFIVCREFFASLFFFISPLNCECGCTFIMCFGFLH